MAISKLIKYYSNLKDTFRVLEIMDKYNTVAILENDS